MSRGNPYHVKSGEFGGQFTTGLRLGAGLSPIKMDLAAQRRYDRSRRRSELEGKAKNVKVDIDHAWVYYHRELPYPKEVNSHGTWCFAIGAEVKYFPGIYEKATAAAKKYAAKMGKDTIYLKP